MPSRRAAAALVVALYACAACSGSNQSSNGLGAPEDAGAIETIPTLVSNDAGSTEGVARKGEAGVGVEDDPPPAAEYPISYWCAPPDDFTNPDRYREIADANFTFAMNTCLGQGSHSVAANHALLDSAHAAGLKAYVWDHRIPGPSGDGTSTKNRKLDDATRAVLDAIIAEYKDHPALAGYMMDDEPVAPSFTFWGEVFAYFKSKDPSHPPYINLLPTYAASGLNLYGEYVQQFADVVAPAQLSYDHYALLKTGDRDDFFSNLFVVGEVARAHEIPFWNIVLAAALPDYRQPTEAELRWQAMQTLAYGGKGVLYFSYWSFPAAGLNESVIRTDGSRTPVYDELRRVNGEVRVIGRYLLGADLLAVFQNGPLPPGGTSAPDGGPVSFDDDGRVTVGLFKTSGRQANYVLLANVDHDVETTTHASFATGDR